MTPWPSTTQSVIPGHLWPIDLVNGLCVVVLVRALVSMRSGLKGDMGCIGPSISNWPAIETSNGGAGYTSKLGWYTVVELGSSPTVRARQASQQTARFAIEARLTKEVHHQV